MLNTLSEEEKASRHSAVCHQASSAISHNICDDGGVAVAPVKCSPMKSGIPTKKNLDCISLTIHLYTIIPVNYTTLIVFQKCQHQNSKLIIFRDTAL